MVEASARSAFQRSAIGWLRLAPSSYWNRFPRRISRTMSTATALLARRWIRSGSAPADLPGLHRFGRRRPIPLLRFDSAQRASQIGGSSRRGWFRAAADQAVAEGTDRGTG